MDDERFTMPALDAADVHVEQVDQEFAHADRVCDHGGLFRSVGVVTNRFAEPPPIFSLLSLQRFYPRTP